VNAVAALTGMEVAVRGDENIQESGQIGLNGLGIKRSFIEFGEDADLELPLLSAGSNL
jgi:hypothetical protein